MGREARSPLLYSQSGKNAGAAHGLGDCYSGIGAAPYGVVLICYAIWAMEKGRWLTVEEVFNITLRTYPRTWYELNRWMVIGGFAIGSGLFYMQVFLRLFPNVWIAILGISCHTVGFGLDTWSTHLVMTWKAKFDERMVSFPLYERNPLLPDYPTLRNMLSGKSLLANGGLVALAAVLPSTGMAQLFMRLCGTLHNLRQIERLQRTLQILDRSLSSEAAKLSF